MNTTYEVRISYKGEHVLTRTFNNELDARCCQLRQEWYGYSADLVIYTESEKEYAGRLLREHGIDISAQVDDDADR